MPKKDKDGREYIEQDGKRYYQNFWGEWKAEKDWLGNDKVERDWLGNPKIERDIFGNQKIERDFFGNPYVEPEKDDSGCYITTACIRTLGNKFDDNCDELVKLRYFRDTYVKKKHPKAIDQYYEIAPSIVYKIGMREDCQAIYGRIYSELVIETLKLIEQKQYEPAYNLYKKYSLKLAAEYC